MCSASPDCCVASVRTISAAASSGSYCCLAALQGGNVEGLEAQLAPITNPTSPAPAQQQESLLLPELNLNFPTFGQNRPDSVNRTAAGNATAARQQPRVQLGPGSTTESLAQDITAGRYVATNLDK
jgi:hypothetical protein